MWWDRRRADGSDSGSERYIGEELQNPAAAGGVRGGEVKAEEQSHRMKSEIKVEILETRGESIEGRVWRRCVG